MAFDFPRKHSDLMKLLVFGGTGLTGGLIVEMALKQGHQVVVLTRDTSRFSHPNQNLEVIEGSAKSQADIEQALRDVDAAIHCLGIGGKGIGISITAASTAAFLLQQVGDKQWVKKSPSISN